MISENDWIEMLARRVARRRLLGGAAGIGAGLVLVGCGGGPTSGARESAAAPTAAPPAKPAEPPGPAGADQAKPAAGPPAAAGGPAIVAGAPARTESPGIVVEETMVPSSDPGIELHVRNKRPAPLSAFRSDRTVLFVHGATYPSTAFDLELDGLSWVEYVASRGYDVYAFDIRGYGKSTRPEEMAQKAEDNPPIVRGDTAVRDISTVVEFILSRRKVPRLDLVGHSWGADLTATYTTQHPAKVERLVLYAPAWIRTAPTLMQAGPGPLGAYRTVIREQARTRRYAGAPEDKKATLIPAGWFDAWADAVWATDPVGARMNPPVVRAPNGVLQDGAEYWSAGKAYYDPAKITAPTLLVGAEWDRDNPPGLRQALFPLLVNSPGKRYVELAEGSHAILMEKNRLELFKAVQAFLDEAGRS